MLKGLGYAAIAVGQALEDLWNLNAEAIASILKGIGFLAQEIAGALEELFQLGAEAIVGILHGIGEGNDAIIQAIMVIFDVDEATATAIYCLAVPQPPFFCLL
jgi:hypothetical protein